MTFEQIKDISGWIQSQVVKLMSLALLVTGSLVLNAHELNIPDVWTHRLLFITTILGPIVGVSVRPFTKRQNDHDQDHEG